MTYVVKLVSMYDTVLEASSKLVMVEKNSKVFIGKIFRPMGDFEKVEEVLEEVEACGEAEMLVTAYEMLKKCNLTRKASLKTMCHWAHINNVVDTYFTELCKGEEEELYRFLKDLAAKSNPDSDELYSVRIEHPHTGNESYGVEYSMCSKEQYEDIMTILSIPTEDYAVMRLKKLLEK